MEEALKHYWEDRATVRRIAGATGYVSLIEKLAWQDVLRRQIGGGKSRGRFQVLDAGTGTGKFALIMSELGHTVTGIDWSKPLLEVARQRMQEEGGSATFQSTHVATMPFASEQFDTVTAFELLPHLLRPSDAIKAWQKVLKPGGNLIIAQYHLDTAQARRHLKLFRRAQLHSDPSPMATRYAKLATRNPLWEAGAKALCGLLDRLGFESIQALPLHGQLAQSGRWRLQPYTVTPLLITATKAGSISIPVSPVS